MDCSSPSCFRDGALVAATDVLLLGLTTRHQVDACSGPLEGVFSFRSLTVLGLTIEKTVELILQK